MTNEFPNPNFQLGIGIESLGFYLALGFGGWLLSILNTCLIILTDSLIPTTMPIAIQIMRK